MSLVETILTFATAVAAVLVPVFTGHAIATHEPGPFIAAAALLVLAFGLGFAAVRLARRSDRTPAAS